MFPTFGYTALAVLLLLSSQTPTAPTIRIWKVGSPHTGATPHDGMPPGVVDVRRPIGIEIVFDVRREGKPLFPKIKVIDQEGAIAFNAMDTDERWLGPTAPGSYSATAWIPGNLLNEGPAIVEAAICSIDFPKLEHHAAVYEAVSFEVLDAGEGDSARGTFGGQWRGVVRPLLDWRVERV